MPLEDRHDWLLVQVQEFAEAVRKVAVQIVDADDDDELERLDDQTNSMLEDQFDHPRVAVVDSRTAALILRPPARIRAYAELLAHKAALERKRGREDEARALARRALELMLEAAALEHDTSKIDHAAIAALLELTPPPPLGARHQELLAALLERLPA